MIRVWPFYDGFRLSVRGSRYSVDRYGNVRKRLKTRRDEFGKPVWLTVSHKLSQTIRDIVIRETGEIPIRWDKKT